MLTALNPAHLKVRPASYPRKIASPAASQAAAAERRLLSPICSSRPPEISTAFHQGAHRLSSLPASGAPGPRGCRDPRRRLAHKGTSRRHPGGKRTGGGCARRSNATDARPRIDLISPHSSCPHPSRRMDRSSRPDWSRARCAHPSTRRLVYPAALVQKWRVSPRPGVARSHDPRARRR